MLAEPGALGGSTTARVLVIEDEPALRRLLERILAAPDFRVIPAATGRDGLGHLQAQEPDLVLLDLGLPDLDGLEVCRRIRARSGVPIIILTAVTDRSVLAAGLRAGADEYMTKPFSPGGLVARIEAALGRAAPDAGAFRAG